jgi:chromosome segregation protein
LGLAQQLVGRRQEVARAVRDAERLTSEVASCQTQYLQAEAHRDAQQLHLDTLAQRTLEDLNLDLTQATPAEGWQPVNDRAQAERELASLRDQLARTGAVNLEALREVDELQERYDGLHAQYQDLTAAKASLDRIIARINSDSRRLFLDTLEAIRENFRVLYRKSFGGGTADLVLEEGVDPLEAGVEIVATPPGKPSFANSLLSGGERALTAVALLMAIFQYRPSPFCILDEVDAPFDEANIGRFIGVLNEFLGQTKFVIVTHSKKTMTAATTLYGVTMQESGVSMQVSVRFEDVAEDGQIASAALARAAQAS